MINQNEFIKAAEKAFEIADFSHKLTHRVIATAAKRLIDYGFSYAEFRGKFGADFKFDNTKRAAKQLTYVKDSMTKIVSDSLVTVDDISYTTAKKHLGRIPDDRWDGEAFIAALLFGDTYKQRAKKYTDSFKNEIQSYIKIGQEEKMTADGVLHWYMDRIEDPKSDELVIAAIASGMIEMSGLSAYRSFRNLNDDMIVRGFARANSHYWKFAEAKFIIAQKDSHTCDTCFNLDGQVFPIDEDVIPVHGSCRCIEVPIMNVPY